MKDSKRDMGARRGVADANLLERFLARTLVPPMPIDPQSYNAGAMDQFQTTIRTLREMDAER